VAGRGVVRPQPFIAHTRKGRLAGMTANAVDGRAEERRQDAKDRWSQHPPDEMGGDRERAFGHDGDAFNSVANR